MNLVHTGINVCQFVHSGIVPNLHAESLLADREWPVC